jgi:hypothetical protein
MSFSLENQYWSIEYEEILGLMDRGLKWKWEMLLSSLE